MNGFQDKFMGIAKTAYDANNAILERYKNDAVKPLNDLYRELSELQHAEAYMAELTDKGRLRLFFEGLETRFIYGLKKFSGEFTEEAIETYRSYDKKLKNLISEEGVRAKDLYHHIDANSETEYSASMARVDTIRLDTNVLREVEGRISLQSEIAVKKVYKKKIIFGIILPIIIAILAFTGVAQGVRSLWGSARSNVGGAVTSNIENEFVGEVIDYALDGIFDRVGSMAGNIFGGLARVIGGIVFIVVWLIYYLILAAALKKGLISKLGQVVVDAYNNFVERHLEMHNIYGAWLTSHFEEMNKQYFLKYKPLIEMLANS